MNYTAVPFNLGICKIALLSTTASQLREQNTEPTVYTEGKKKQQCKKVEENRQLGGGLCDNPLFFFSQGWKETRRLLLYIHRTVNYHTCAIHWLAQEFSIKITEVIDHSKHPSHILS